MAKEYEIPDFPGYTIDEDKKVYSYKKGKKKELSICIKEGTSVVAIQKTMGNVSTSLYHACITFPAVVSALIAVRQNK